MLHQSSNISAGLAIIIHTLHDAFNMAGCTVHPLGQLINLVNHLGNILLVGHRHLRHNLSEGIHILGNPLHILEAPFHGLLNLFIPKYILKGTGNMLHARHQITRAGKELVHATPRSSLEGTALPNKALSRLGRRHNMDILFTHNTICSNGKYCSLGNFNIIIYLCNNLHLIGRYIELFHGAYLHTSIAHHMTGHQPTNLRIVDAQLITLFSKGKGSHKSDNACQHHCATQRKSTNLYFTCSHLQPPLSFPVR